MRLYMWYIILYFSVQWLIRHRLRLGRQRSFMRVCSRDVYAFACRFIHYCYNVRRHRSRCNSVVPQVGNHYEIIYNIYTTVVFLISANWFDLSDQIPVPVWHSYSGERIVRSLINHYIIKFAICFISTLFCTWSYWILST